ncbi:MAG: hypothetical protein AABX37_05310 [Nanoarchaeota archaeon]
MRYLFTNVLGSFVIDENIHLVDSILFSDTEQYLAPEKTETTLIRKHLHLDPLPKHLLPHALLLFKEKHFLPEFKKRNLLLTKNALKQSVSEDILIMQAISSILELDKMTNILSKRLREWYGWYFPELSEQCSSHEKFVELIITKSREELQNDISQNETMGADLSPVHVEEMRQLALQVHALYQLRRHHEIYLEQTMKQYCPNLLELAGTTIAAQLIELGKGLKHLALLPSSTIQLLGAEKALFRHLKTGSRSPKHGIIINHPLVQNAKWKEKGKMARSLADKLSLCARLDYFKGEFKAPEYRQALEKKL